MSLFSTSGSRPAALTPLPGYPQAGKAVGLELASANSATGKIPAKLPTVDPVAMLDDVVSLSAQGLEARGAERVSSNSDNAQNFMNTFARRLFGDGAEISSVAYNLSSFSSTSRMSASSTQVDSDQGTVRNSTFDLSQSASFTGVGQITTGDGSTFDFELSVKYEAKVEASSTSIFNKRQELESPDVLVLTGKPLPAIKFPGSLDDLFKLLSRELRTEVNGGADPVSSGNLTLRLQRLVDRAALLAPRLHTEDPEVTPADRAKALAHSYGLDSPDRGLAAA